MSDMMQLSDVPLKRELCDDTSSGTSSSESEPPSPKRACSLEWCDPFYESSADDSMREALGDLGFESDLPEIISDALLKLSPTEDQHADDFAGLWEIVDAGTADEAAVGFEDRQLHEVSSGDVETAAQQVCEATAPRGGRGAPGGAAHNRKEWTEWEDAAIRSGVLELGLRWRAIAARLPGRSDDAVRNRWARLQNGGGVVSAAAAAKIPMPRQKREGAEQRHSWTAEEDAIILSCIAEWGRRWNRIGERLPNRTEHAIRNRWHRLQMTARDGDSKESQLAPAATPSCAEEERVALADRLDFERLLPTA